MAQSLLTLMLVSMTAFFTTVKTNISNPPITDPGTTEVVNEDLSDILSRSTACDFVYGFDIQEIFETKSDVIGEETIKVDKFSTCAYHWTNSSSGNEEHLELWMEVNPDNSQNKFSQNLEETLANGELRHPMKPAEGRVTYELVDGPGDMTIWSSETRVLRWHLKDNVYFTINLDEKTSKRKAQDDLKCLIKLANQVNERIGIQG